MAWDAPAGRQAVSRKQADEATDEFCVQRDGPPVPQSSTPVQCCSPCAVLNVFFVWTPGDTSFFLLLGRPTGPRGAVSTSGGTIGFVFTFCLFLFTGGVFPIMVRRYLLPIVALRRWHPHLLPLRFPSRIFSFMLY